MAGIGVAIRKQHLALMGHAFHHCVRDYAGAQWQIARRKPLSAGDHIGLNAVNLLGCEPMAQTTKAGDYLVRDVENVIGAADIKAALVIPIWRHNYPTRAENRFRNKRTNVIGTDCVDGLLNILDLGVAPSFHAHIIRTQVGVHIR